jgi:hypothetical protein
MEAAQDLYKKLKPQAKTLCNKWLCKRAKDENLKPIQRKMAQQALKMEQQ